MLGCSFLASFLGFPILCVRSILSLLISTSKCSFIVSKDILSVFSYFSSWIPCIKDSTPWILLVLFLYIGEFVCFLRWFVHILFQVFDDFWCLWSIFDMKYTVSCNSLRWFSPLICLRLNFFVLWNIFCISFPTILLKLIKIATHSRNCNPSVKTSSRMSLTLLAPKEVLCKKE